jgi:hypothetical protein
MIAPYKVNIFCPIYYKGGKRGRGFISEIVVPGAIKTIILPVDIEKIIEYFRYYLWSA